MQLSLIVLFGSCMAVAMASVQIIRSPELGLLNLISDSGDAIQNDPQQSLECFNYYIPLVNSIAETYENNFKACLAVSAQAQESAEEATAVQRNDLASSAEATCSSLTQCKSAASAEDVFQCYISQGASGAKSLVVISNNATVELAALQEAIRRIENDENVCTTQTKIQYEDDTESAYSDFRNCMSGNGTVPPATTTTEEPATTTEEPATTTEEPATTTEEPATTTEEPATTTEEPATTTEEPATTTEEPATTTEEPATTTEEPATTTEEPATTTKEPATTTEEPLITTEEPATTIDERTDETTNDSTIQSFPTPQTPQVTTPGEDIMPEEDIMSFIRSLKQWKLKTKA